METPQRPQFAANVSKYLFASTLLSCTFLSSISVARADETGLATIKEIQDLQFGESLYYFFQRRYFSSATELLIAQKRGRLHHHGAEAQLLLGGLYLSYGLFDEAEKAFQEIIDQVATPMVRNHAWFHLGELFYQRGRLPQAQRALLSIKDPFPVEYQERRTLLLASIYLADKQFDDAVKTLQLLRSKSIWATYGRYNLGVALIRAGRIEDGIETLDELSKIKTQEREILALRDKANLAAGFALIKTGNGEAAETALSRARLRGPYSNEALYGMAQALYLQGKYEQALNYWQELAKRSQRGAAVLEAKIAIPQTFFKIRSYSQALEGYEEALRFLDTEISALDRTIAEINQVNLLEKMLQEDKVVDELDWLLRPHAIPDPLRHHFITQLLASHGFNEAMKTYRDLRFFQDYLLRWKDNVVAFDDMLTLRSRTYAEKLPQVRQKFDALPMESLQKRYNDLAEDLATVERDENYLSLANAGEMTQLIRLKSVEQRLSQIQTHIDPDRAVDYKQRHQFLYGTLAWNLARDFSPRLYNVKKELKQTRKQLRQTASLRDTLLNAQQTAPKQFANYKERITDAQERIERLLTQLQETRQEQEQTLRQLAIQRLNAYKARLTEYKTEAQFVMAQIYDEALQRAPTATEEQPLKPEPK